MIVCIAEDRASFEVPVKLLLLSLAKHAGNISVELFFPGASANFTAWISRFSRINLNTKPLLGANGWNVKPQALLALLEAGHDDVLWIDSDIIVTRDFQDAFDASNQHEIVATEEALWGHYSDANAWRAQNWGLKVGRNFPFTLNTAVLRVTPAHIPLLMAWQRLLESEVYKNAQRLDSSQRPGHLFGDQDVLTALLTSTEFSDIDVRFLKRGSDIIQYFGMSGYTCAERFWNMINGPPRFVHSQVSKPWVKFDSTQNIKNMREALEALYLDLSPYTLAAAKYRRDLNEGCPWMEPQSMTATVFRIAGLSYPPMVGLPIAAMADFVRLANLRIAKRFYFGKQPQRDPGETERLLEKP